MQTASATQDTKQIPPIQTTPIFSNYRPDSMRLVSTSSALGVPARQLAQDEYVTSHISVYRAAQSGVIAR
jgi:hypothetical protein